MDLDDLVTRPVSILKAKLWNVVMNYKNMFFLTLESFFSKCEFLGSFKIFSRLVFSSQLNFFSGNSNL